MLQKIQDATIAVDIEKVTKNYGSFTALSGVSLDIRDNEFFTLLGPSGCGKTTLLRSIAGFEEISDGAIRLYGEDIAGLPPHQRPVNTVFQQYALFPHMTVAQNVLFGLQRLRKPKDEAQARCAEVLELVQLSSFAARYPNQLSGGQQQRVALARALAPKPKLLLLDEPLSALDLKLRQAVRVELKQIQKETGITFIFVTHDQEEALTMSDRIAVMSAGEVQQVGTPRDVYEAPRNRFVADFIGETNLLDVTVTSVTGDQALCVLPGGREITCPAAAVVDPGPGHLSVRPERMTLTAPTDALLSGRVENHVYLGTDMQVMVRLEDDEVLTLRVQNSDAVAIPAIGSEVGIALEAGAARLLAD
ncbi:ABC transporter ATP-binding protein [Denitrobaculum tricleocarpae]|uniref:ABC transporter ATP-binding protein n=1 Tax=Denitrobaculum tricleocarpae TaxID=2591009 RepID=UPI001FE2459A|nr:ABC transporter ATP-binding protein [Denitrobaculum tricleocarpae]